MSRKGRGFYIDPFILNNERWISGTPYVGSGREYFVIYNSSLQYVIRRDNSTTFDTKEVMCIGDQVRQSQMFTGYGFMIRMCNGLRNGYILDYKWDI